MTQEEVNQMFSKAKDMMQKALDHLSKELSQVRTGKASPSIVGGISVEYYGTPTPLNQVANVSTSDSRTLVIQPWEKTMIAPIEKAIMEANIGLTPQNDGEVVRLSIPPLTEERRKDLVKRAKGFGEDAKVGVRNARRDLMDNIKKAVKGGLPEDEGKKKEGDAQNMTNDFTKKIDDMLAAKETDIMTV